MSRCNSPKRHGLDTEQTRHAAESFGHGAVSCTPQASKLRDPARRDSLIGLRSGGASAHQPGAREDPRLRYARRLPLHARRVRIVDLAPIRQEPVAPVAAGDDLQQPPTALARVVQQAPLRRRENRPRARRVLTAQRRPHVHAVDVAYLPLHRHGIARIDPGQTDERWVPVLERQQTHKSEAAFIHASSAVNPLHQKQHRNRLCRAALTATCMSSSDRVPRRRAGSQPPLTNAAVRVPPSYGVHLRPRSAGCGTASAVNESREGRRGAHGSC